MTNLQYLVYYSLNDTTSIGAAPNIIADWEQSDGDRFTVPVGTGINKTINIGKVPVHFGIAAIYSVLRPDTFKFCSLIKYSAQVAFSLNPSNQPN